MRLSLRRSQRRRLLLSWQKLKLLQKLQPRKLPLRRLNSYSFTTRITPVHILGGSFLLSDGLYPHHIYKNFGQQHIPPILSLNLNYLIEIFCPSDVEGMANFESVELGALAAIVE